MPHLPAFMVDAPSMPAGGHEMRESYLNHDPPRSSPHTAPSITPYLGLRARLSQVWFNRWTILLLLVLARTLIAISGINSDLSSARREALSACTSVESMGSAMASMPHYMSDGVNDLTAKGVEKAVNGLFQMTVMSVTGVEEIVVFVINLLTSTYLCLITLAVSGSLHSGIEVVSDANLQLKTLVAGLGDDMADILSDFDDALSSLNKTLSTISIFDSTATIPGTLELSDDVEKLRQLQLPDNLTDSLQKLNDSIPDFAQVQNLTNTAIRFPFELLKREINESLGTYTFDRSVFPVPQKESMTFCSDNDGINEFFDDLNRLSNVAKKVFIAVLLVAAILVCIPMAYREIKRWRIQQDRARLVGSDKHDPMDAVYIVSRPYTSTFGLKVSSKFGSVRRQALVRWVIAYATTEAALFVLALAIAGLFSCLCQLILLKSFEKEVPNLSAQVGQFADKVIFQLNNASASWSNVTNSVITSRQDEINDEMFGWVNTSVNAINDTLNTFVQETTNVLNTTFGGTILYDPITEVFNCLIGLKIAGFQRAMTWVAEHAHVAFPLMPNDTFSLGAVASIGSDQKADSSFLATPGDAASDKISSAVARFVDKLEDAIRVEAIISTFILLIWIFIVCIGIMRAVMAWNGRERSRGEGGAPVLDVLSTQAHAHAREFYSGQQDSHPASQSIPLEKLNDGNRPNTPAPNYSQEDPFSNSKTGIGYAGHRDDNHLETSRTRITSERGSIWYGDNKQ